MGKTGISVSEVAFGGIPIQTVPRSQALASVRRALDLGINFIDTARGYTTSESIIGHAIKGRGSECVIATKTLARTAKDAQRDFKASLSFLEISSIDLYQIHNVNNDEVFTKVVKRGGVLDFIKRLRREGLGPGIGCRGSGNRYWDDHKQQELPRSPSAQVRESVNWIWSRLFRE